MFFVLMLLVVRQITCDNTTTPFAGCDDGLCVNNTALVNSNEAVLNSSLLNRVESTGFNSNSVHPNLVKPNDDKSSPLISEKEFLSTSECYRKVFNAVANIAKSDYENFAHFLNEYSEIKNRTEVAMLLTHVYRQTNGFERSSCAFKRCVAVSGTNTIVNYGGRGYIHLYGEQNYASASYELFGDDTLVRNPDLVATNQTVAWKTAFWFWMRYVHSTATSGLFGATIPMIWGDQQCANLNNTAKFDKIFSLYVCISEKMNLNEVTDTDGCAALTPIRQNYSYNYSTLLVYIIAPISAFIIFVTTIVIVFYIRHRRPKSEGRLSLLNPFFMSERNLEDIGYKPCYEFPINRLIMKEELGSGFFGVVMKAKAIGLQTSDGDIATVAVKKVKEQFDSTHQASLLSELKIFLSLGKHLNIINFLGAVTKNELMLIFEFCEYGSLREYLIQHREFFVNQLNPETFEYDKTIKSDLIKSPDEQELKTYELICYSYQVSQGMEYLSARNILHRDLAARNVLLTKGNIVKLCDFGLAKDVYHYGDYCTTSNKQMPVKWMSIEAVRDRVYTTKNDVWAFGIVLWEIFSLGCDPYPGVQIDEQFLAKITNGYRMESPDYCPNTVSTLMKACWEYDPKNRPQFETLTSSLRNILDESTKNYYLQLNDNYVKLSTIDNFEASKCYTNIYSSVNPGFEPS